MRLRQRRLLIISIKSSENMAGTIRAQYPDSIRNILVPCSGRVGPDLILRAFGRGADGVVINA
jgi:coenzyme F420-reducing hydrogenase delta subunit